MGPHSRQRATTTTSLNVNTLRGKSPPRSGEKPRRGRRPKNPPTEDQSFVKVLLDYEVHDEVCMEESPSPHLESQLQERLDRELTNLLVSDLSKKVDDLERHLQYKEDVLSNLRESLEKTHRDHDVQMGEWNQQLLEQKSITDGLELKCDVFEAAAALALEKRTESEILRRDVFSRVEELEALVSREKAQKKYLEEENIGLLNEMHAHQVTAGETFDVLSDKIIKLRTQVENLEGISDECEHVKHQLASSREEVALLESENRSSQSKVEVMRQEGVKVIGEVKKLKRQLVIVKKRRKSLANDKLNLKKEACNLQKELSSEREDKCRLVENLRILTLERNIIKSKLIDTVKTANSRIEKLKQDCLGEINRLKSINFELKSQLFEFKLKAMVKEKELIEDLKEANSIIDELV